MDTSLRSEVLTTESFDVDVSCFQKTLNQSEDGTSTGAIRDIGQPRPVYLSNNLFSDKKRQFPIKCKIEHWHWRSNGGKAGLSSVSWSGRLVVASFVGAKQNICLDSEVSTRSQQNFFVAKNLLNLSGGRPVKTGGRRRISGMFYVS